MFIAISLLQFCLSTSGRSFISSASASEMSMSHSAALAAEMSMMAHHEIFPLDPIPAIDPLSKEKVDKVKVGPTFQAAAGAGFDYYRYVTFYDVEETKDRIYSIPIHREQCFDKSDFFGSYQYSVARTATITVSGKLEALGIDLSLTQTETKTFLTGRNIRAVGGIVADHIPSVLKRNWNGRTFIQTYSTKTKKAVFILNKQEKSSWWMRIFFPMYAATEVYPMPFDVKDAEWVLFDDRQIISKCADDKAVPAATEKLESVKEHPADPINSSNPAMSSIRMQ